MLALRELRIKRRVKKTNNKQCLKYFKNIPRNAVMRIILQS